MSSKVHLQLTRVQIIRQPGYSLPMLRCQDVSKLVSESLERRLSFVERMRLRMHLAMCRVCNQFQRTVLRIHAEVRAQGTELEPDAKASSPEEKLPDESRERIERLIKSQL